MSLRSLNSPPLVAMAGISTLAGIPFLEAVTLSASPMILKGLNLAAFACNGKGPFHTEYYYLYLLNKDCEYQLNLVLFDCTLF